MFVVIKNVPDLGLDYERLCLSRGLKLAECFAVLQASVSDRFILDPFSSVCNGLGSAEVGGVGYVHRSVRWGLVNLEIIDQTE